MGGLALDLQCLFHQPYTFFCVYIVNVTLRLGVKETVLVIVYRHMLFN